MMVESQVILLPKIRSTLDSLFVTRFSGIVSAALSDPLVCSALSLQPTLLPWDALFAVSRLTFLPLLLCTLSQTLLALSVPRPTIYGRLPKRGDRRRGPRIHFGLYNLSFSRSSSFFSCPFTRATKMLRILLLLTLAGRALAGDIAITVQSSAVPDGELPLSWQ